MRTRRPFPDVLELEQRTTVVVSPEQYAKMKNELDKGEWFTRNRFTLVEIFDEDFDQLSIAWFLAQGVKL